MANSSDRDTIARLLAGLGTQNRPTTLADLVNYSPPPKPTSLADAFAFPPPLPPNPFGLTPSLLGGLFSPAVPPSNRLPVSPANALYPATGSPFSFAPGLGMPAVKPALPVAPAVTKRKGFFSFHFDDLLRVNNVRNAWKISHPDREIKRNFYDRSLWEGTKLSSPERLKNLIRNGMNQSSAVCVMIGSETWARRWVRYEIARAVVDGRGLLAIHINSLRHHQRRQPDPLGWNPLDFMGIYHSNTGSFYLYELNNVETNLLTGSREWLWQPYDDHRAAVALPKYMTAPQKGHVARLSNWTTVYNHVADRGSDNLGAWIDAAAKRAGR